MDRRLLFAAVVIGTYFASVAAQQVRVLQPVDEAARNPDFLAFRNRLKEIIAKRDSAALLEIVHPDIKIGFGGNDGIKAFREEWKPHERASMLWKELGDVLKLGGTFDGPSSFIAPYTFSRWPDAVDAFDFGAVTGARVRIRSAPSLNAATIKTVSYEILELAPDAKAVEGWTAVKLDATTAYINSRYIRSAVDYRAMFSFSEGRWRMVLFLAGD